MNKTLRITLQVLAAVALAVMAVYMIPKQQSFFKYHFAIGQPWGYNLMTAEFDFAIYKSEDKLQEERTHAMADYAPCYVKVPSKNDTNLYIVSAQEHKRIIESGCHKISVMKGRIATTVELKDIYTPGRLYELTKQELQPNLEYDSVMSENIKKNLLSSISLTQGMVQTGEKIIDTGEVVTPEQFQVLLSLKKALEDKNVSRRQSIIAMIGKGVLLLILLGLFVLYLLVFRRYLLHNLNNTLFFVLLMGLLIASAFLVLRYTSTNIIYLIPFAWVPIITRVFYDSRTALFLHIITVLIVSLAVPSPYLFIVIQISVGMVAVAALRDMTQRSQLVQCALYSLCTYIFVYTALVMAVMGDFHDIDVKNYFFFAINAVLLICSYGLIYLFEKTFNLVSNITLVELTNVNSDLMLTFAEKAPGTFQHSLQVSNLATEAAKQIGAKVLLVRTGALYHDIGKMLHPEYFTENQMGENPLMSMSTQDAAKAIIAHATDGEILARKHHLPEVIIHFIRTHHGTSVVRYFYNTAINAMNSAISAGENTPPVNLNDYMYPGPKPATKEAAILMMADAIEARSRSLNVINEQTISDMVDQMIRQQVSDGQFSETPLSFKDLEEIRAVFKDKLLAMNHHRISYPEIRN